MKILFRRERICFSSPSLPLKIEKSARHVFYEIKSGIPPCSLTFIVELPDVPMQKKKKKERKKRPIPETILRDLNGL